MRIANYDSRLVLVDGSDGIDVFEASRTRFGPSPSNAYEHWTEFRAWAHDFLTSKAFEDAERIQLELEKLGSPSPTPPQVFAIAMNYGDHVREGGYDIPSAPGVFTKFQSSIAGPFGVIQLPDGNVDWEIELVVVIGQSGHRIHPEDAWDHVAGLTVGQDISERIGQHRPPAPQFSLAKSYPGFSPMGPWLTTPDECENVDNIEMQTLLNDEVVQQSSTGEMIFDVPSIISHLSQAVTLFPGDVIFTGTPAGVGKGRTPPLFLSDGDVLRSSITGLGTMRHELVARM